MRLAAETVPGNSQLLGKWQTLINFSNEGARTELLASRGEALRSPAAWKFLTERTETLQPGQIAGC